MAEIFPNFVRKQTNENINYRFRNLSELQADKICGKLCLDPSLQETKDREKILKIAQGQ